MKKKIHLQFMVISALAILLTLFLSTVIFYGLFKTEVMEEIKTYAQVLKRTESYQNFSKVNMDHEMDNLRVTVIRKDGQVLSDSEAETSQMGNHLNRKEIREVFDKGEGQAIRNSDTMGKNTFYYAILLEDGNALRVGKEAASIFNIFLRVAPVIVALVIGLFSLSFLFSHFLTRSLVYPIEQMSRDMEHLDEIHTYKELMPYINTIKEQHENILQNAKMRQEFTANVSHELKTPLTAISGYSELIQNGMANRKEAIHFAGEINKSAQRLITLINDTIRLSELDAPESEETVVYEEVDLYRIAEDCVNMLTISAEKHGVEINMHGRNAIMEGNKEMLEEVVYNLCDNAIRYNKKGGKVDVTVRPMEEKIYLCVEDNGIGIKKEHQERIFERFYRVDKSHSKSTGGTGLGLAIVKHIIQQSNAKMKLTSEKGKGTKIEIKFSKSRKS